MDRTYGTYKFEELNNSLDDLTHEELEKKWREAHSGATVSEEELYNRYVKILSLMGRSDYEEYMNLYNGYALVAVSKKYTGDFIVPEFVNYVYIRAFGGCSQITGIKTQGRLKVMGRDLFDGCEKLERIEFAEGINEIKENKFRECTSLKELVFPESLKILDICDFTECTALETLRFGYNIEIFGQLHYNGIAHIKNLMIPAIYRKYITGAPEEGHIRWI